MPVRFICMAVPKRLPIVAYLQEHIPELEISVDTTGRCSQGWLTMLRLAGDQAIVAVEDDIILTQDFKAKVLTAIKQKPDDLIQFHSRVKDDAELGSRYRSGRSFLNNQCVYYPPGLAQKVYEYAQNSKKLSKTLNPVEASGTDECLADYLSEHKKRYWVSVPSLVDHLPVRSMIDGKRGRHGKYRQARVFRDPEFLHCPPELAQQWNPISTQIK